MVSDFKDFEGQRERGPTMSFIRGDRGSEPAATSVEDLDLLPPATKWRLFFQAQGKNPTYLKEGDVIEIAIATDDGALDLGRQRTEVRQG